jgi:hypothetical protein
MDYIVYMAIAVAAYYIGWHLRGITLLANLTRDPDRMIDLINQLKAIQQNEELGVPEDAIEVEAEHVNGMVYAYNKASGEFLAQAQNLHQALVEAAKRYPGKQFWHPELKQDSQTA